MKNLIKPAILGLMTLLLLIVLSNIEGTVRERAQNRKTVNTSIAQSWTGPQIINGPWLVVEYRRTGIKQHWDNEHKQKLQSPWVTHDRLLLRPKSLKLDGALDVSYRQRGLFKVPVYSADIELSASFDTRPLKSALDTGEGVVSIERVFVSTSVKDARGFVDFPQINWDGQAVDAVPGSQLNTDMQGFHALLPLDVAAAEGDFTFSSQFRLRGIELMQVAPVALDNQIKLSSNWPHPSFIGDFLPHQRVVNEKGFQANWAVSSFAAGISLTPETIARNASFHSLGQVTNIGVRLFEPVDIYTLNVRATKYGVLFIILTFAAFYLFEVLKKVGLHPIQYLLTGLAQASFFLLLLSFSEHLGFSVAYIIATAACIGLIAFYVTPLVGLNSALLLAAGLSMLYGACYIILMQEDHALLMGSVLMFIALGSFMLLTRRVDWYALTPQQSVEQTSAE